MVIDQVPVRFFRDVHPDAKTFARVEPLSVVFWTFMSHLQGVILSSMHGKQVEWHKDAVEPLMRIQRVTDFEMNLNHEACPRVERCGI